MTLRTLSDPKHPTAPLSFTLSGNELMQVVHTHVPLSPNRINRAGEKTVIPAAGKVTVGLASQWPCITDFSGLSIYGLTA